VKAQIPPWLAQSLDRYLGNPAFEVLLPSIPVSSELGYALRPSVSVVQISANPADREIFKVGSEKVGNVWEDRYAYSKQALEKMAEAAGIHIATMRMDDRSNPDYCEMKARAAMRGASGQPVIREATKAFYMPDVEAESWRNRVKRNERAKPGDQKTEPQLKEENDAEMTAFRKHLLARTESGAMLRVVRNLLAIKSGLSREQVAKPKVLVRVEFQPDPADPVARTFMLEQGSKAMLSIYGPPAHEERHTRELGPAVVTEPEDDETMRARAASHGEAASALPQGALPPAETEQEPDYFTLIQQGSEILGLTTKDRNDLFVKHGGDLKAIHQEISQRANQDGGS